MRTHLCVAAQPYYCNNYTGEFFEWKCYTNNRDVLQCGYPRHRNTHQIHMITIFFSGIQISFKSSHIALKK